MTTSKYIPISKNAIDITGVRYGRLVALGPVGRSQAGQVIWDCQCDCGEITSVYSNNLRRGLTQSCGCLHVDATRESHITHGQTNTPTWNSYNHMKQRCQNPKNKAYHNYGGRGIKVCERWESFENFFADMGEKPKGKSLDRIDNSGDYEPQNCRWATPYQQGNNKRNNILIAYDGEIRTLSQWAEITGFNPGAIHRRIKRGWSIKDALFSPLQNHHQK